MPGIPPKLYESLKASLPKFSPDKRQKAEQMIAEYELGPGVLGAPLGPDDEPVAPVPDKPGYAQPTQDFTDIPPLQPWEQGAEDWDEPRRITQKYLDHRATNIGPDEHTPDQESPESAKLRMTAAEAERIAQGWAKQDRSSTTNLSGLMDPMYNAAPEFEPPMKDVSVESAVRLARDSLPFFIPGGTKTTYIEPPIEQFIRENAETLDKDPSLYTEHDMAVKEWRDQKFTTFANDAVNSGRSYIRQDVAEKGLTDWVNEAALQTAGTVYNIDYGAYGGMGTWAGSHLAAAAGDKTQQQEHDTAKAIRDRTWGGLAYPGILAGAMSPVSLGAGVMKATKGAIGATERELAKLLGKGPAKKAAEVVLPRSMPAGIGAAVKGAPGAAASVAPAIAADSMTMDVFDSGISDPKVLKRNAIERMVSGVPLAPALHVAGGALGKFGRGQAELGGAYHEPLKKLQAAGVDMKVSGLVMPSEMVAAMRKNPDKFKELGDYMVERASDPMVQAALREKNRVVAKIGGENKAMFGHRDGKIGQPIDELTNELQKIIKERSARGIDDPFANNAEFYGEIKKMFKDVQVLPESQALAVANQSGRAIVLSVRDAKKMFGRDDINLQLEAMKQGKGPREPLTAEGMARGPAPPEDLYRVVANPIDLNAEKLEGVIGRLDNKANFVTEAGAKPDPAWERLAVAARRVRNQFGSGPLGEARSDVPGVGGAPSIEVTGWAAHKHRHDREAKEVRELFFRNKLPSDFGAEVSIGMRPPREFKAKLTPKERDTFDKGVANFWSAGQGSPAGRRAQEQLAKMAGVERELFQVTGMVEFEKMKQAMSIMGGLRSRVGGSGAQLYAAGIMEPFALRGGAASRSLGSAPDELISRISPSLDRMLTRMLKFKPRAAPEGQAAWLKPDFMPGPHVPGLRGGRAGFAASKLPEGEGKEPTAEEKAGLLVTLAGAAGRWAQGEQPTEQQAAP